MESVAWSFGTLSGFALASPILYSLLILLLLCWDYVILLPRHFWRLARFGSRSPARPTGAARKHTILVVIPSLLRKRDELKSMMSTIESVANNGYPGRLLIVVSIDGYEEAPDLYSELEVWAQRKFWNDHHWLYVTGTPHRHGKPMAIDHAVEFVKKLVARGEQPLFPEIYISTDADADLGPDALERMVERLCRRHPLTGWPARAVAGNLYVRGDDFWRGWKNFFTIKGQLSIQVAREYLVTNVARHNYRWMPLSGVPGVLYCTWTDIFLQAPRFMGYMRTIRLRHWLKWWLGFAPPRFSDSRVAPVPELLAGDTDDTVMAYMSIIARYKNGRFTVDPPRTPLHAFYYMLRAIFLDRALRYEPEARVYTSSPNTIKSLFKQRRRWNSSRIEVTGRFWRGMCFHWSLGLPAMGILFLIAKYCLFGAFLYLRLPMAFVKSTILTAFVLGYSCQLAGYGMLTIFALTMNGGLRRYWRLVLALPLSPLYAIMFTYSPSVVGASNDVLFFGNVTGFAPESTLIQGGSFRVAILFRIRRALALAVRAVVCGDVPFGSFWFGWRETTWTPNGYEGWTTRKKKRAIVPPVSTWFRQPVFDVPVPAPLPTVESIASHRKKKPSSPSHVDASPS
jgi:cellulose synthase/poly-beta-1,6-N-acetylglucosamine synthase-like glycosyltransferase